MRRLVLFAAIAGLEPSVVVPAAWTRRPFSIATGIR
jgi:hypothetical protein